MMNGRNNGNSCNRNDWLAEQDSYRCLFIYIDNHFSSITIHRRAFDSILKTGIYLVFHHYNLWRCTTRMKYSPFCLSASIWSKEELYMLNEIWLSCAASLLIRNGYDKCCKNGITFLIAVYYGIHMEISYPADYFDAWFYWTSFWPIIIIIVIPIITSLRISIFDWFLDHFRFGWQQSTLHIQIFRNYDYWNMIIKWIYFP